MGRLAETIAKPVSGRQYSCKINTLCADDDDRAAVAALMSDNTLSVRAIARTLNVSEGTAFKHRSKECQCYKGGAA
jgi:transposase-like protein